MNTVKTSTLRPIQEDGQQVSPDFQVEFTTKQKVSAERLAEKMGGALGVDIDLYGTNDIGVMNDVSGVSLIADGFYGKPNEFTLTCAGNSIPIKQVLDVIGSDKSLTFLAVRFFWYAAAEESSVAVAELVRGLNIAKFTEEYVNSSLPAIKNMIQKYNKSRSNEELFNNTLEQMSGGDEYLLEMGDDSINYDGSMGLWVIGTKPTPTLFKLFDKAQTGASYVENNSVPNSALAKWFTSIYPTVQNNPGFQAFCNYIATGKADNTQDKSDKPLDNSPEKLSESIERIKFLTRYLKG